MEAQALLKFLLRIKAIMHNLTTRPSIYVCPVDHAGGSVFINGRVPQEKPTRSLPPIILVHDIHDSPDQCLKACEILAEEWGVRAYTFELRLHRRRQQKNFASVKELASDLLQVVAWVRAKTRQNPILVGQGLGAIPCIYVAQRYERYITAIIMANPALNFYTPQNSFKQLCLKFLARTSKNVKTPRWLYPFCEDKPLPEDMVSVRLTQNFLNAMIRAPKLVARTQVPLLILAAKENRCYTFEPLRNIIEKHRMQDRVTWEDVHESAESLLLGSQQSNTLRLIVDWMKLLDAS
jgi:alpha-beta hydrolase superfamily lysophospholipase